LILDKSGLFSYVFKLSTTKRHTNQRKKVVDFLPQFYYVLNGSFQPLEILQYRRITFLVKVGICIFGHRHGSVSEHGLRELVSYADVIAEGGEGVAGGMYAHARNAAFGKSAYKLTMHGGVGKTT
jgi:hypothetical protein